MTPKAAQAAGEGAVAAKLQRDRPEAQRPEPAFGSPAEPSEINAAERYKPLEAPQTFQVPGKRPLKAGWVGGSRDGAALVAPDVMAKPWGREFTLCSGGTLARPSQMGRRDMLESMFLGV